MGSDKVSANARNGVVRKITIIKVIRCTIVKFRGQGDGWVQKSNKMLPKKLMDCLLDAYRDLDLCGSISESNDQARFAREGKYDE